MSTKQPAASESVENDGAKTETRHKNKIRRRYQKRWPVYAALIFTAEAILAIVAWTHFYGDIQHRPLTAHIGPYQVTVLSARISDGDATFHPGKGYSYVIANVQVANTGKTTAWVAPVVQSYLKSQDGKRYELAPATVINAFEAGTLEPQQRRTGELSYVIPATTQRLSFCFTDSTAASSGSGSVCVPLKL